MTLSLASLDQPGCAEVNKLYTNVCKQALVLCHYALIASNNLVAYELNVTGSKTVPVALAATEGGGATVSSGEGTTK
jgi:hypothetical protein